MVWHGAHLVTEKEPRERARLPRGQRGRQVLKRKVIGGIPQNV
jgi:hypothetical protein